ncbi:hypothetical protein CVD28_14065 [Bacillus sp. M6-12]|uniref:hypothetical protein n=1 Tax=Bacillus sp. M6-12 TaxID=2054166 RepID=UPI000C761F56|nr:hypothetical protein [Bacillus sp. M6-12]PLS17173.1 hypothetical protein CVD28_14065 [Bacillus sp. M6-12]
MSLEWFDRVSGELQDHLESICDKFDQEGGMTIERGAKHPRIDFYTELEDDERAYFCTLLFDPHNEEFYMESVDPEFVQASKVVLTDIEDIVDAVHESFHDFMDDDDMDEEFEMDTDYDTDAVYEMDTDYDTNVIYEVDDDYEDDDVEYVNVYDIDDDSEETELYEIDVEWETPEVTAYYKENDVEVTYQFGVVQETGDGVLKRINRIYTDDDDMIKDETNFMFSKEEAGTIIAMIASHMDSLSDMEH